MNAELEEAYRLLRRAPPLKKDCGRLCGRRCCQGEETEGMWLFPGEEVLFAPGSGAEKQGFTVRPTQDNLGYPLVVCEGSCDRERRPLACRIYPLFPLVEGEPGRERIRLLYDPRGQRICPLAGGQLPLDPVFRRAVRRAARVLLRNPQCADYLRQTGAFLQEIAQLQRRMEQGKLP